MTRMMWMLFYHRLRTLRSRGRRGDSSEYDDADTDFDERWLLLVIALFLIGGVLSTTTGTRRTTTPPPPPTTAATTGTAASTESTTVGGGGGGGGPQVEFTAHRGGGGREERSATAPPATTTAPAVRCVSAGGTGHHTGLGRERDQHGTNKQELEVRAVLRSYDYKSILL